jgi:23S rRNA (cytosine1962-C5)-methyltransferase
MVCPSAMALHGLSIPGDVIPLLERGAPSLDLERLPSASGLEPGRPVRLLDKNGDHVASGVVDPENGVIRIFSRLEVPSFDAAFFRRRVEDALALRRSLALSGAHRLLHGEGDRLPGFAADRFGDFAVLWVYARAFVPMGRLIAEALLPAAGLAGVVVKVRPREGVKPGQIKQEIVGREPPEKLVVEEDGVPFEVHLLGGLNVGLFTDMREHRRGLARFVRGKRVLNTFCYTGALSVASAKFGAASVTSVDLSSGVLRWAEENFRLSGFAAEDPRWRFEASDVVRFLEKNEGPWDSIILDPPTFSAARAHSWSMKNDYPDLIALAASRLAESGGHLWVSANQHRGRGLAEYLNDGMEKAKRRAQVLEIGGLGPDYPTPLGWDGGRYLEVAQLWVS